MLALIRLLGAAEGWNSATRTLLCVPLAFTGGIVNNFAATYGAGGTLVPWAILPKPTEVKTASSDLPPRPSGRRGRG